MSPTGDVVRQVTVVIVPGSGKPEVIHMFDKAPQPETEGPLRFAGTCGWGIPGALSGVSDLPLARGGSEF
jgi:hypothetical protein